MPKLNENYLNVQDSYLFAEIARRVKVYEENNPDKAGKYYPSGNRRCNTSADKERH